MKIIFALGLVLLIAGCSSTRTGSLCTAGPIILDRADQLTRPTTEQIVAMNEAGVIVCGWKAP